MINDTILLLTPFEDCSRHKLAKHIGLKLSVSFDVCFYQPLQKFFSRVILYDYLKQMVEVGFKGVNREVLELVRKEHPKYVLWVASGEGCEIQESTFDIIRKEGTQVIGWFFDDEVRFEYYSKLWIPYLDYFVTNDPEAVPKYRELHANAVFAITDTWDSIDRDWSRLEEKYDVSFVGSLRADRAQYLEILKNKGMPVNLFGIAGGKFVSYQEMMDIFAASKINLNFSRTYDNKRLGIKGRIFKVCLAGGFLLTEYVPGIERYFEIDREIVCFRTPEEMADKITYYLKHDIERQAIAQAGWKRATNQYTAFQIMSKVFNEIEEGYALRNSRSKLSPPETKMPRELRKRCSADYSKWARAFSLEDERNLCRDASSLSLSYNLLNFRAWYYYIISYSPNFIRSVVINLDSALGNLDRKMLFYLRHVPYLKKIKQRFVNRPH